MTSHTPGPWFVGETLGTRELAVIGDGDSVVCQLTGRAGESVKQDARLIAAAPDLLDALLLALPYVTDAEGFPEPFKPGVVARDVAKIRAAITKAEQQ